MKLSLGYITAPTRAEAKALAQDLLTEGLIACANIVPGVESHFVWEGKLVKENEVIIFIKTRAQNEEKIIKRVRKLHSYECPCVTFIDINSGNADFLKWVDGSC